MTLVYACFRRWTISASDYAANLEYNEAPEPLRHGWYPKTLRVRAMADSIPDIERAVYVEPFNKKEQSRVYIASQPTLLVPVVMDNSAQTVEQQCIQNSLVNAADRILGILEVPVVLIFGILLYLVDVGSDIAAAVSYFQEGHQLWGSLTVTFVVFPCICSAAFSWTYWYLGNKKEHVNPTTRKVMMVLSVLLLEPLVR